MPQLTNEKQIRERLSIHIRSTLYCVLRLFEIDRAMSDQANDLPIFECVMELAERAELKIMENEASRIQKALGKFFPDHYFEPKSYWFEPSPA